MSSVQYYAKFKNFEGSIQNYKALQQHTYRLKSPFRRYIKRIFMKESKHRYDVKHYIYKRQYKPRRAHPFNYKLDKPFSERCRLFVMNHGDEILSADGVDLDIMAQHLQIDQDLPIQEKQEQVFNAISDSATNDHRWTREEIARMKQHFIETIEKTHFVNLTCSILQLKESLVRNWIKTDGDFAAAIRSAQVRFGERVGHSVLVKAINGDMAAAMYVLKEFKDSVNFIDPQVEDAAVDSDSMVANLSAEEQETLLQLTRKAKQRALNHDEISNISNSELIDSDRIGVPAIMSSEEKFAGIEDEDDNDFDDLIDVALETTNDKEVEEEQRIEQYEGD